MTFLSSPTTRCLRSYGITRQLREYELFVMHPLSAEELSGQSFSVQLIRFQLHRNTKDFRRTLQDFNWPMSASGRNQEGVPAGYPTAVRCSFPSASQTRYMSRTLTFR